MEMIRLEHVTKSFGTQTVLNDFSLSIEEGEILTVIGRSGCGKTTMLKTINGLSCRIKELFSWRARTSAGRTSLRCEEESVM